MGARRRSGVEAEIRGRLKDVEQRARRALDEAHGMMKEGRPAVEAELARLDALRRETESLVAALLKGDGS